MAPLNQALIVSLQALALAALGTGVAAGGGVTAYLPLNLEPERERQIERVLILADEPLLKRPFAVELVKLALPKACERDKVLCAHVTTYLERYSRDYALTHASLTGAKTEGGKDSHGTGGPAGVVPNEHGLPLDAAWEASAQGIVQPNDYFLASAGFIAYSGRTIPTGSVLSLGFHGAQLDIGFRDHWFSPATNSTMMIGTESPTMPSVTLSNYEPLTRFGFQYEFFLAQMARSDHILGGGQGTSQQRSGNPKLFGTQLSIEPFSGWSFGVNRQLQYGGGGLPDSASFLARDFFRPGGQSQTQGNQEASYVTRFIHPGRTPFAVYAQYAGENTLDGGSYLLGQAALTIGIDFPRLWHFFDLTFESSEWQDGWYTNNPFLDGMTNDRLVTGHWGADQRLFGYGNGVGARSEMLRIGWEPPFGGYLEERVRTLVDQTYGTYAYRHYIDGTVRYSRPLNDLTVGGEMLAGRDVFGKSFARVSAFVRYGGDARTRSVVADDEDSPATDPAGAEIFIEGGASANKVRINLDKSLPTLSSKLLFSPHVAVGVRREVSAHNDWGVRVELDDVNSHSLLGVRPIDYRHRYGEVFALGLFAGVDRYDLATPAYGLFGGIGAQWMNVRPKWDIGVDFRYAQNIARNRVLASDLAGLQPAGGYVRPDIFYKIETIAASVSRRF